MMATARKGLKKGSPPKVTYHSFSGDAYNAVNDVKLIESNFDCRAMGSPLGDRDLKGFFYFTV